MYGVEIGEVDRELNYLAGKGKGFESAKDPMKLRAKLASEVVDYYNHYLDNLQTIFRRGVRHWKLYMSSMKDSRKPWEKWRSRVPVPYGYSGTETSVSTMQDLLWSMKNPVQPEATPDGADEVAERIGQWFDYVFRRIRFKKETDLALREMLVQGLAIRKSVNIRKERDIFFIPSKDDLQQFQAEMERIQLEMGLNPPKPDDFPDKDEFYDAFAKFREVANSSGARLPEFPKPGPRRVKVYWGPGWKRVNYFGFFYDPLTQLDEQETVIQRSIVPLKWVLERAGEDERFPFDPQAVQGSREGGDNPTGVDVDTGGRLNQWQSELADVVGVNSADTTSPQFEKAVEILECYKIGSPFPFRIVMNRKMCINKRKDIPFDHGGHPYTLLSNVELPFSSASMGDLLLVEPLLKEMNTLRGLRLDSVMLSTLPVFARMREAGMTEMARRISPGIVFDSARGPQSFGQVSNVQVPSEAFKELYEIKDDIDTTNATQPLVRGQIGPSKITATHTERAREGAALRTKQRTFRFEDDMATTVDHFLSLANQFYDQEEMDRLSGNLGLDIMKQFKREDFLQAINWDYAFRAATTAVNKELNLQQKKDLFVTFVNSQVERFKPYIMAKKMLKDVDPNSDDVWMTEEEFAQAQAQAQAQAEAQAEQEQQGQPQQQ
jgi:hypothetical protein